MSRWRSKWKYKERDFMKRSEKLFVPALDLKWVWKGTAFELHLKDKLLWSSVTYGAHWDYIGANRMAQIILKYINTPVEEIKKNQEAIVQQKFHHYEPQVGAKVEMLLRIMIAADRRLGKNYQSVRLFTEPDRNIRNIIGSRL